MITIAAVDQQYVVMYNNSRISRFYKERRAAEAALHRMVRKQVVEYADRCVDYDEVADALWAMAHDAGERGRALREGYGLVSIPRPATKLDRVTAIAVGNAAGVAAGWPLDVCDTLRAYALDALDEETACAVYWG
jgi:hypothetical protein